MSAPNPPSAKPNELLPLRFDGVGYDAEHGAQGLLENLNFEIDDYGITAILGPNGAGKSLTLRLAHGLLSPTRGRITWHGGITQARRKSALLFQKPVLLRRSALANVTYALALHHVPRAARRARADEALEAMGLKHLAHRSAHHLSGGEAQRLALARARALKPAMFMLDEPASALDPAAAAELEAAILKLRDAGTKILFTTHDLAQAERMADQVLLLHRGRLMEQTPAARFFSSPQSPEGRQFLDRKLHTS